MPKKKGKTISFDAMVKFFMQNYDIPTKKDVDKLMAKLDRLENLIKQSELGANNARGGYSRRRTALSAVDIVLDTIKNSRQGLGFTEIQAKTGFDEKKIRNTIFRLNKIGKIKRKRRGIYIAS
jgi:Fic family protein